MMSTALGCEFVLLQPIASSDGSVVPRSLPVATVRSLRGRQLRRFRDVASVSSVVRALTLLRTVA